MSDPIHPEGIYACNGCGRTYAEYLNGCLEAHGNPRKVVLIAARIGLPRHRRERMTAHRWIKCSECDRTIIRCRCPGPVTGYEVCAACKSKSQPTDSTATESATTGVPPMAEMTTGRPCVHPSDEMVRWIKLAVTYERAGLGNDISDQTDQALQGVFTFLTQPAQVYGPSADDTERLLRAIRSVDRVPWEDPEYGAPPQAAEFARGWNRCIERIIELAAPETGGSRQQPQEC